MLKTRMNRFALIVLALAPAAVAQESAPLKLSLQDAVALALRQNPQVILANLDISQSRQDTRIARSALLPQVNGTLGEGVVLRLEAGGVVVVRFAGDGSERRLMLDYAPLEKI